jgi:hypothetical protein
MKTLFEKNHQGNVMLPHSKNLITALSVVIFLALEATSTHAHEATDTLKADEKPLLKLSGYFDTYYFSNLNKPASRNNLGSSGVSRGFDRYAGQFQIGMLLTRMDFSHKALQFLGEVGYGPNVEYGSYGNDFRYRWGTVLANSTYSAIMIKQAYLNYTVGEKLTFTMGQFGTHIGYEFIDAPLNFHYSINNTFNAGIPFYHTGVKASYAFSDKVSLMAGVVNGTDNINDNNRGKSFIGQLSLLPYESVSVFLNTIQGNEANARVNGSDTSSYFGVLDLTASIRLSKKATLGLWAMHGTLRGEFQGGNYTSSAKNWYGVNVYMTYKLTDYLTVGSRLEYFNNESGARALLTNGNGTSAGTMTITANLSLADDRLLLKPEYRLDEFQRVNAAVNDNNAQQFMDINGNFSKSHQSTVGMAAIVKF